MCSRCLSFLFLLLTCCVATGAFAADTPQDAEETADKKLTDLELMEGKWERKADAGIKYVQTIDGSTCVLEIFHAGRLVHKQTGQFELREDGLVKVINWEAGKVLAGPRIGQAFEAGRVAYRLEGNRLTRVLGILSSDKQPVSVEVFYRVLTAKNLSPRVEK